MTNKEVFEQKINDDELEDVTGGDKDTFVCSVNQNFNASDGLTNQEDSCLCDNNDVCNSNAIGSKGMEKCGNPWAYRDYYRW